MTPRDFFYPRVALDFYQSMTIHRVQNPNVIHFTIDGRHELFTLDKWNHLTAYVAPPGAPDMPAPPETPQAQQAEIPTEIIPPAPTAPTTVPMPEATSSAPPTTLAAPPVVPATSTPLPSESSITISTSEFRGLCHTLQTLSTTQGALFQQMTVIRAHQDQLIAMQTQHTAILSQMQHLGILPPPKHDMPSPSKSTAPSEEATPTKQAIPSKEATPAEQAIPSEEATPAEQTMPHEETTIVETTTEPSSPHDPPTTT
ncbi:hypothetical protein AAG906_008169 [Vitis piasezkii]